MKYISKEIIAFSVGPIPQKYYCLMRDAHEEMYDSKCECVLLYTLVCL